MLETPSQTKPDKETITESLITIRARTAAEELAYFQWMLSNKSLLQQYNPTLPSHDSFLKAWQTESYEPSILNATMQDLYDPQQYDLGLQSLENAKVLIEIQILPTFQQWQQTWGFRIYPKYEI